MGKVKLLSSEVRHDDGFLQVTFDRAIDPFGFEIGRAVVRHGGSAVILPENGQGQVLLESIFRLPIRQTIWELPAGRIDPGETALKAAKRELLEETGLSAKTWRKLVHFYASPGFLEEKMTIFHASHLNQGAAQPSDDERMKLRWFTRKEVEQGLASNLICDGKTIIGLRMWLAENSASRPMQRRDG